MHIIFIFLMGFSSLCFAQSREELGRKSSECSAYAAASSMLLIKYSSDIDGAARHVEVFKNLNEVSVKLIGKQKAMDYYNAVYDSSSQMLRIGKSLSVDQYVSLITKEHAFCYNYFKNNKNIIAEMLKQKSLN